MSHTGPASFMQVQFSNVLPIELIQDRPVHVLDLIRTRRKLTLPGKEYNSLAKKLEVFIPKGELNDWTRSWMEFDLTLSTTPGGAAYLRASNCIWNCISEIELREGDRLVTRTEYYNYLQTLLYTFGSVQDNEVVFGPLWGIGSQASREGWAATTRNYAIPISMHALTKRPINTHSPVHKSRLKITIQFAQANYWVEASATFVPEFLIENVEFHYEQVTTPAAYKNGINRLHKSEGVKTVFDEFMTFTQNFDTQQFSLALTPNKQAIRSIFTIFVEEGDIGNYAVDDKFETYEFVDISSYRHKFGNHPFQDDEVLCDKTFPIEPYMEYLRLFGHLHAFGEFSDVSKISVENFRDDDKFLMVADLETATKEPGMLNNVSTHHEGDVDIEVKLNSVPASKKKAITFVHYQAVWQHGAGHSAINLS